MGVVLLTMPVSPSCPSWSLPQQNTRDPLATAQTCSTPAAIPLNTRAPETFVGLDAAPPADPAPSSPNELSPQQYATPALRPHATAPPVLMALKRTPPDIATGDAAHGTADELALSKQVVDVDAASCPRASRPQQNPRPSVITMQA